MGFLFDAYFKNLNIFWANLPYNLNWSIKKDKYIKPFLSSNPLNIADIGARGGNLGELENLKEFINYYAFDADKEECENLRKNPPKGFYKFNAFPNYVGDKKGEIDFHLFKLIGSSSALIPGKRYKDLIGGEAFDIARTVRVESSTLDEIVSENKLSFPDMIKMDTQGNELNILMSSPESVKHCCLIESEVEYIEMYEGQYLFFDMCNFLYDQGFELLYLNRVFHNRRCYYGEAKGQIIWGDMLFGRREDKLQDFSIEEIAKYVVLLVNYGHLDYAYSILQKYPEVYKLMPDVNKYMRFFGKNIFSKAKRVFFYQYDKLLSFLLHLRKTNKGLYDSDRCWPIR